MGSFLSQARDKPGLGFLRAATQALFLSLLVRYLIRMLTMTTSDKWKSQYITPNGISIQVTNTESELLESLVSPSNISCSFESLAGMDDIIEILQEQVVWPLKNAEMYDRANLIRPYPSGVLLHGRPGTGKTTLAKALAKSINGHFLQLSVESLFGKWVGSSERLTAAVFSLAEKLQPCVIFVDEIDSILSHRSGFENAVYSHTKSIFLSKWSTLAENRSQVLLVGATNLLSEIDGAARRRFSLELLVPLPSETQRKVILKLLLKPLIETGRTSGELSLELVARRTPQFTGADLKTLCESAMAISMRPIIKGQSTMPLPLTTSILLEAISLVHPSGHSEKSTHI